MTILHGSPAGSSPLLRRRTIARLGHPKLVGKTIYANRKDHIAAGHPLVGQVGPWLCDLFAGMPTCLFGMPRADLLVWA